MMTETPPFTIEQFYKFVSEKKLMAAECVECGTMHLPPRPLCNGCFSSHMKWVELKSGGRLLTYTVIHIAPKRFESLAPYPVGIVELEDGLKLPGIIRDIEHEKISVGMRLEVGFETVESSGWPVWPRYFFKAP